ncbi:MAG: BspA family leucine-rich repeat surface protein [Oscillospiraceae bacterium]|nr:BspA family leucine-rich repeat surface protein [Oscillospiraceae bacterium]
MILINNTKRCEHCFSELRDDAAVCEQCRNLLANDNLNSLKEGTVLMGKYVVGMFLYNDEICNYYMGFDPEGNRKVFINEFFRKGLMARKKNSASAVLLNTDADSSALFKKSLREFHRDTRLMSRFGSNDGIADVYNFFDENNTAYSVVSFPENGITLDHYLKRKGGRLSEKEAVRIMKRIIRVLSVVHNVNAVHGNIRPENIIIDNDNVILTGFYNGKLGVGIGSLPLMINNPFAPPEQYQENNTIGPWSDIYALGSVTLYMITGIVPESAVTRVMDSGLSSETDRLMGISEKLSKTLSKMTETSIDDRYRNIDELFADPGEKSISRTISPQIKKRRKLFMIPIVIICVLLILCGSVLAGYMLFKNKGSNEASTAREDEYTGQMTDTENSSADAVPGEGTGAGTEIGKNWMNNVMRSTENDSMSSAVLGNNGYNKTQITAVEFRDSLNGISENAWDISQNNDGSVKAWVIENGAFYNLFIGAEGGINAENSLKSMFMGYINLETVDFNGCLHTSYTTDMSFMFKNCKKLKTLDLSDMSTPMVKDMSSMFENCTGLSDIRFSESFKTNNVTSMAHMFDCCFGLTELDISMFDTGKVSDMSGMFFRCLNLNKLDFGSSKVSISTDTTGMFDDCGSLTELKTVSYIISEAFNNKK